MSKAKSVTECSDATAVELTPSLYYLLFLFILLRSCSLRSFFHLLFYLQDTYINRRTSLLKQTVSVMKLICVMIDC